MDLERILHSQGFGSRKECWNLIRAGRVTVGGAPCDDSKADFSPEGLVFAVDGEAWTYRRQVYLMLNKPAGYECSHQPQYHASVFSLLPRPLVERGVQCVGRLDEDTSGLLLLADDGQFIHAYSSPKKRVPKVYDVTTKHPVGDAQLAALRDGVLLHDERAPLAAVAAERSGERRLLLTVAEGKYHQVKRMIGAAGNRVEALARVAVGGLALPADLAPGQWRWLAADDLQRLRASPA